MGTFAAVDTDYIAKLNALQDAALVFSTKAANFAASNGNLYYPTANSITATLPASPTAGNRIVFARRSPASPASPSTATATTSTPPRPTTRRRRPTSGSRPSISTLLYPNLSNTNDNGVEIGVPWYWNIAPEQDATIEPRYFTSRGFMLSGEYRYLARIASGELEFDYMPDDSKTDESRYHYRLDARAWPLQRWRAGLVVDRVGDDRYFQDFGSSLYQTSLQYLYSNATVSGVGRFWNLDMLVDIFQVIDESVSPANEPYRRLPRINFWLDRPFGPRGLAWKG